MYAQVCTHLDITFVVCLLGRYLSDPKFSNWKMAKKIMRYFQGTKINMLTYRRTNNLDIVGFSDFDYVGYMNDKKSISDYIFLMVGGVVSWKVSSRHSQCLLRCRQSI